MSMRKKGIYHGGFISKVYCRMGICVSAEVQTSYDSDSIFVFGNDHFKFISGKLYPAYHRCCYTKAVVFCVSYYCWIYFHQSAQNIEELFFGHFSSRLESEVCRDIKGRLVRKLSVTKLVEIERVSMGQLLSRYNEDVEKVSKFVLTGFQTLFFSPFMSVCGFLYLFHYSWKLSVGVFLPIPLFALILNFYSKRAGGIYEDGFFWQSFMDSAPLR